LTTVKIDLAIPTGYLFCGVIASVRNVNLNSCVRYLASEKKYPIVQRVNKKRIRIIFEQEEICKYHFIQTG
jgi:hypothetical protein